MKKIFLLGFGTILSLNFAIHSESFDASHKRGFPRRESPIEINEKDNDCHKTKNDCCCDESTIIVPLKPTIYLSPNEIRASIQGTEYANFISCEATRVGDGYSICDNAIPPRITICEPGRYEVSFTGTANSTLGPVNVYLVELSTLGSSDPIFLGGILPNNPFSPLSDINSPLVGENIYNFCHISEKNPPSFAIKLENSNNTGFLGSPGEYNLVTFNAGSAIKIKKLPDCPFKCEECCSPCCPILPPTDPNPLAE